MTLTNGNAPWKLVRGLILTTLTSAALTAGAVVEPLSLNQTDRPQIRPRKRSPARAAGW